jgi:hypothetical protein
MDTEDNKLDNSDPEQVGTLNKKDVDIVSLEIDMEHHIFIGGITQSGKSYFLKHLFDKVKLENRRCIFLDYKHDPDHVKWIKKNHYPVFTDLKTLKRYWNPKMEVLKSWVMGKKKTKKKVIFRPPRPANGFIGAFQMLDDLADYGFRQGNIILFIDEIAPLVKATRIPDGLYDCLIMGASRGVTVVAVSQRPKDIHNIILSEAYTKILFRLNLEDDRKKIKGIADQEVADALHNLPNTHFIYVRADGYHQICRLKSD